MNVAIENAVDALLPLKRAGEKRERPVDLHTRDIVAAAGGPAPFIAWASSHPKWRFNVAEAPNELHAKPTALADYVVKSILEELLDRQAAKDAKAGWK